MYPDGFMASLSEPQINNVYSVGLMCQSYHIIMVYITVCTL